MKRLKTLFKRAQNVTNQFKFKTYITNQISTETNFLKNETFLNAILKTQKLKISQTKNTKNLNLLPVHLTNKTFSFEIF